MCRACEHRHVPPMGANCPHVQPRRSPGKLTARGKRLATRQGQSSPSGGSDYSIPCSGTVRRQSSSPAHDSSSEDENASIDLFHPRATTSTGKDAQPGGVPKAPPKRGRPMRSTLLLTPPHFSLANPTQPSPALQQDVATMILEQMRQMQEQNQREFLRLEQQSAADHLAVQQALQALNRPPAAPAAGPPATQTLVMPVKDYRNG